MIAEEIAIVVPSRGRPESVWPLAQAWKDTGAVAKLIIAVDDDDPTRQDYSSLLGLPDLEGIHFVFGARRRLAGTLNHLICQAPIPLVDRYAAVGFMGDDHRPRTAGWDRRFAECLSGGTGVVYGNDLLVGDKFPTAVVMTSDIPRTLGYFCPPGFIHLCLDLVWKDWGSGIGRITYLGDVIIEHMHPANGKSAFDERYAEVNSTEMVNSDTEAYMKYKVEGLDKDIDKLKVMMK